LNTLRNYFQVVRLFLPMTLSLCLLNSCDQTAEPSPSTLNQGMGDDTIIAYNHQVVQAENQEIDDFIRRYQWSMNATPTGLRFMIYKKGNGVQAKIGTIVTIHYTIKKIDGDVIDSTDPSHPLDFELGKHELNNGLEEGVLLMKTGDRAKFILPSHLAYGLLGDLHKIPSRTILVYDLELVQVKQKQK